MRREQTSRLGIDIGRVIIDGSSHPNGGDTAFIDGDEQAMLDTPEMNGAFDAITRLVEAFDGEVWLVSKCGPRVRARTRRWLAARGFHARTGISPARMRFCRRRPEKRKHCLDLQLTHFVDDHPAVHQAIRGAVHYQFFFGPQRMPVPDYGTHVHDWSAAQAAILDTLPTRAAVTD
uniref:Uncharacterized protein n=1 Tax=Salinispora arenicola (strain CNS-205) TaxID=391037 RepID=A8M6H4_SALAI